MKPLLFYDTECYPNYWLFMAKDEKGNILQLDTHTHLSNEQLSVLHMWLSTYTFISFNGINYDKPVLELALTQVNVTELKSFSDDIILRDYKWWNVPDNIRLNFDHIDLFEVAKGKQSLKKYGARMGMPKLEELPYDPNTILTPEQCGHVVAYCENDIDTLIALWKELEPKIRIRQRYGEKFGLDLRSKSDAQISETILNKLYQEQYGIKPQRIDTRHNLRFKFKTPKWMRFLTPQLQTTLKTIESCEFNVIDGELIKPDALKDLTITFGNRTYKMGIGGLHSQEKSQYLKSTHTHTLVDADVASNYPQAILNSGEYPPAIGPLFRPLYSGIKDERIANKKKLKGMGKDNPAYADTEAMTEGGKIMLNGPFGKMNSPYSTLFAPSMFIQTTVGNQLALLMLMEWVNEINVEIVSANTDGILIYAPNNLRDYVNELIALWEKVCNYETEITEYSAILARDVNNYFALKRDGKVKRKGEYSITTLDKDPDSEICSDAVEQFLTKGANISDTIHQCRDIRKFLIVQKVTGGCYKVHGPIPNKTPTLKEIYARIGQPTGKVLKSELLPQYLASFKDVKRTYVGKTIRFYIAKNCPGVLLSTKGTTIGHSEGAQPCMNLPNEFPGDLDHNWYIQKAYAILKDIGYSS